MSDSCCGVVATLDSNGDYLFVDLHFGVVDNDVVDTSTLSAPNGFAPSKSSSPSVAPSGSPLGSISRNVQEDTDNDDIGEVNPVGVTNTLSDSSNSVVASTLTDSNGDYLFVDLPVGVYCC